MFESFQENPVNLKNTPGPIWDSLAGLKSIGVVGNKLLPCYHHGDLLLVSRQASVKPGDRVAVQMCDGEIIVGQFIARNDSTLVVTNGFRRMSERTVALEEIDLFGRIMWASQ